MQMRVVQHHINYTWIFIMLSKNKTCRNLLKCCGTQTLIVSPQKRKKERKKERKWQQELSFFKERKEIYWTAKMMVFVCLFVCFLSSLAQLE